MNRKTLLWILIGGLLSLALACSLTPPGDETPIPTTVIPTKTPRATATPLPPKPVVAYTPVPAGMLSPIIVQRSPKRGESLSPDSAIELIFDQAMDPQAVAQAFTLQLAGENEAVAGNLVWADTRTLRFTPAEALPRDNVFDVILTQNARTVSGEPLREPYTFRFATAGYLEVGQVIPAPDTADVETDATITVMFNRPVVPLTSLKQMEDFPHPLIFEPAIEGTGEWLNTSIYVFTPETPLSGGVTYRATVAAGLQDTTGALLAEDYVWYFATVPPKITWYNPRDDMTLVDINTAVTVQFNQPIAPASAQQAFSLKSNKLLGTQVEGVFNIEGNTLVFTPTNSLEFETTYTVNIEAGVTSTAGGTGMKEAYSWQFTTVPLPKIVATRPENLERNVSPYTSFEIIFNTPIDPDTVMPNLTMTPPFSPTQVYTYFSRYNNTFVLNFGAEPSTEYTVVIGDEIADPYGNLIPRGRTVKFRTAQLDPYFHLRVPDNVGTYDAALPAQLVVGHVNVSRLNLQLYRLPVDELTDGSRRWWDDTLPSDYVLLREWRQNLESPLNKQSYTVVDLTETPGGTLEPGIYLLDTDSPDVNNDYRYNQRHVLVVSDLNLTLKKSAKEILVWATDLRTGSPVPNLSLTFFELYENASLSATTNRDGIAQIPHTWQYNEVVVYSENPFAAVSEGWGRGISPWEFGMGGGIGSEDYRAYVYTDRPIYRPGQTVYFKGVIRSENDAEYRLPDTASVRVTIRDAAYQELYNEPLELSDLGTFDGAIELEEGTSLGSYLIFVEFGNTQTQYTFQVAAYRAPEFEVTVTSDVTEVQHGDDVNATIAASYYFGGPLADTAITWSVIAERYTFAPPWGGRYSFDDVDDPYICFRCWWWEPTTSPEAILSGVGRTDTNGEWVLTLDGEELAEALANYELRISNLESQEEENQASAFPPSQITIEATATGPDNQAISGRTNVVVHPGPYYIGLSAQQYVNNAGDETHIDLVAVDWEGTRLPDKALKVELYRREWINTFVENEYGGGYWSWESEETWVDEVTVTTDNLGEAVATFVPEEGGSYHVVATPADPTSETEEIRSSIFIWVSGKDYVSWRRENNDRITLISDKTSYNVGETAEILIPSPFEGSHYALITVERGRVRRHEVVRLESNSAIYSLPITEGDIPNIYVSVVLVKGRAAEQQGSEGTGQGALADFKMGLLPLDVNLEPVKLDLQLETEITQAEPGEEVTYTLIATKPNGEPAVGAELSLDVVDKAVLSLQPRSSDILHDLYARRALQVTTASGLSMSVNRYLEELAEDLDLRLASAQVEEEQLRSFGVTSESAVETDMAEEVPLMAPMPTMTVAGDRADNIAPPEGIEIREEFADTAFWSPRIVTDRTGRASVTLTLPDNLTTWTLHGVGLTSDTVVGEGTADLVATKPLLVRPVAPRFFVVEDRAQLAANVSNNTAQDLEVEVSLSAEGIGISTETPPLQTVTIPAHSERKVMWWATVDDVTETQLVFAAVSGEYADASKPRLTTGPDGSLLVFRYTTPDIVGTAGQLTEGGSQTEAIALPPEFDERRGNLTVRLDPSLAAGMQDGLEYLEHFEYECTEQTISRFLPNILTYRALTSLGIENAELSERLPALVEEGLNKLTAQQNPDGGWGWWYKSEEWSSNPHISAYAVFALLKAQETGWSVEENVLANGLAYLQGEIQSVREYRHYRNANQQAWLLYVLAEGNAAPQDKLDDLFENRDKLSYYARAYLAQALWLNDQGDERLDTLLSDLNNVAILSATGAHWEEGDYDWWAMNTDTRSTAIVLDTLAKLDPGNALIPNTVRWLMVARKAGIWETTQETAWALIALTDWMVETGELDADYDYALYLNAQERAHGNATRETIREGTTTVIPLTDLIADAANALTIARTDGNGRLYYTAHLEVYQPVEKVEAADRGIIVQRRYTLAECAEQQIGESTIVCPDVREAKLGDVIRVDLTLIVPHDRYYVVVEDPLPAGGEAIDTGLATTSLLAMDPTLQRTGSRYWWWWHWYSRSELRDEKVVLFADYLSAGTYEYSYTFRATLPGDYHILPTVAREFYFPEVFGRSDGRLLTIGQ
ncbi:MAG: Ig-like domain-containing protein [Anaerolineae bacterium]|nr:Ig-like domain-containing protein [Anaerolineae bacterium]